MKNRVLAVVLVPLLVTSSARGTGLADLAAAHPEIVVALKAAVAYRVVDSVLVQSGASKVLDNSARAIFNIPVVHLGKKLVHKVGDLAGDLGNTFEGWGQALENFGARFKKA